MALAKITTKGQFTIPKEIRESLRLKTGDKIEIILKSDREAIIRPVSKKVDEVFCRLHKPGTRKVSTEEMDAIIKRKMQEKFT
ncbi:MAG: AbrB/MazE/SpoVT family DNA-binding domain-containing protein [Lascolabacillus sp.]|jgi:antitoxin PrlF|nr:AbrB/MazE/SpoVT family DNA-binding domain-containing protein [Lascolabacillus sp.]